MPLITNNKFNSCSRSQNSLRDDKWLDIEGVHEISAIVKLVIFQKITENVRDTICRFSCGSSSKQSDTNFCFSVVRCMRASEYVYSYVAFIISWILSKESTNTYILCQWINITFRVFVGVLFFFNIIINTVAVWLVWIRTSAPYVWYVVWLVNNVLIASPFFVGCLFGLVVFFSGQKSISFCNCLNNKCGLRLDVLFAWPTHLVLWGFVTHNGVIKSVNNGAVIQEKDCDQVPQRL